MRATRLVVVALAACLALPSSASLGTPPSYARYYPWQPPEVMDLDPWHGNDMNSRKVFRVLSLWEWAWRPENLSPRHHGLVFNIEWGVTLRLTVNGRYAVGLSLREGAPLGWYVQTSGEDRDFIYSALLGDDHECDVAPFKSKVKLNSVLPRVRRIGPPQPRCGQRTVELEEEHEGVTFRTCVDRAWAVAPDIDQLVMVVDAEGRLETVLLLAPLPLAPVTNAVSAPPTSPDVPWSGAISCAALFPPLAPWERSPWRRNVGLAFEWAEPDELISLQMLEDDHETGLFVLFYANGLPATVGYRYEGLQHGMWYYHAPDGCLVEARLYALGVELARPRVERAAAPPE